MASRCLARPKAFKEPWVAAGATEPPQTLNHRVRDIDMVLGCGPGLDDTMDPGDSTGHSDQDDPCGSRAMDALLAKDCSLGTGHLCVYVAFGGNMDHRPRHSPRQKPGRRSQHGPRWLLSHPDQHGFCSSMALRHQVSVETPNPVSAQSLIVLGATQLEMIFTKFISDGGLISKIYKRNSRN